MKHSIIVVLVLLGLLMAACGAETASGPTSSGPAPTAAPTEPGVAIPNPASEFCEEQGYKLEIRDETGGQVGYCLFPDGSECEEWAFYRAECTPDSAGVEQTSEPTAVQSPLPTPIETAGDMPMLAFDSDRAGDYRALYVMNSDGYGLSRLTAGEADSLAGPWSPDGTRIVFTSFGLTASDIWVMNADGTGQMNLTNTPTIDEGFPAWSPDGTHIAFTTRRDGNNEIYVMVADGTNAARWTDNPADDFAPAWSPDGTQIAFVSDRDREPGIYDLYIMDVVTTAVTRLTDDEAIDYSPAWSPDGTRIAFRSHHGGPADIYVINVDGSGLANLTEDPADDWAPSWSPDGSLIAFQTNRDGNWEIYQLAVDGSGPVNLTNDPADDQLPFWYPRQP